GDEAEIIFGAVHDPELNSEVRVTVIATGFDSSDDEKVIPGDFRHPRPQPQPKAQPAQEQIVAERPVAQQLEARVAMGGGRAEHTMAPHGGETIVPPRVDQVGRPRAEQAHAPRAEQALQPRGEQVLPLTRFPERTVSRDQIEGLDIPTFIRRQMD
ncbi:MAG: hypothetical protein PVF90_09630, partial [Gemmatimonadota bacterium]